MECYLADMASLSLQELFHDSCAQEYNYRWNIIIIYSSFFKLDEVLYYLIFGF